jgi:hypothetical protein
MGMRVRFIIHSYIRVSVVYQKTWMNHPAKAKSEGKQAQTQKETLLKFVLSVLFGTRCCCTGIAASSACPLTPHR